ASGDSAVKLPNGCTALCERSSEKNRDSKPLPTDGPVASSWGGTITLDDHSPDPRVESTDAKVEYPCGSASVGWLAISTIASPFADALIGLALSRLCSANASPKNRAPCFCGGVTISHERPSSNTEPLPPVVCIVNVWSGPSN